GPQWPATSPNVVAVGGTSLYTDAFGNVFSEGGWSGSGGGYSYYESEPPWQQGVQQSGVRTFPDVAAVADPSNGVWTYTTTPSNGLGNWVMVGGTSVGAPIWAGILAVADQGRNVVGLPSLDGPSQVLPALYSAPSTYFRTMQWGNNG